MTQRSYLNLSLLAAPAIYVALTLIISSEHPTLAGCFWLFIALTIVGVALVGAGKPRVGAYLAFAGSIIFIPLGVVGIRGARQVLDQLSEQAFVRGRGVIA